MLEFSALELPRERVDRLLRVGPITHNTFHLSNTTFLCMMAVQCREWALLHHTQDNLALRVSFRSLFISLTRLGKGEHRVDDRSKLSRVN